MGLRNPVRIGGVFLQGNLFLAPVAGYTDRVFRGLCVDHGADFTFTELISSEALFRNSAKTFPLLERAANEMRYGIQLFGSDPAVMAAAVAAIAPFRPSVIDINAGCPVPKVVKTGAGSALMKTPGLLGEIVAAVVKAARGLSPDEGAVPGRRGCPQTKGLPPDEGAVPGRGSCPQTRRLSLNEGPVPSGGGCPPAGECPVPVTVKIRSGWDSSALNYLECAKIVQESGAAMVTLHARTRAQGYGGTAGWEHIARLTDEMDIPVCGSGDLFTAVDAERMLSETHCAAVMFARGALGNPFIFEETQCLFEKTPYTPPPSEQYIETALAHLRSAIVVVGEEAACRTMRTHFCRYLKGVPHAATLRYRIVRAKTLREYEDAVSID
ncbi:MAG: tRNA-dihydrouridine synthase [Spirochaetaceae bacterium]|jgi:tRNA-dihydrouridine synthase|nr:tRNA-dihydrouridine synthase [Spirochaetaceae bacterium]